MRSGTRLLHLAISITSCLAPAHGAEPLTLPQAMHRAITSNPAMHSRQAQVQHHELEENIARGQRMPKVELHAGYTRHAHPSLVTPIREAGVFPPIDRDIARIGLALSVPLYSGGRFVAGESLAGHKLEAEVEALRVAGQDLLHNVATTYTKALHLRDLQVSARARIAALEAEESLLSQRLAQGRVARLDLIRLQTQLSQARHDLLAIAQGERDALAVLTALLGSPADLAPLANVAPIRAGLPASLEEALARAENGHPTLRRAQALRKAAFDRIEIAKGERRAQINLVAKAQESAGSQWKGYDDAQIGIELTLPLFDGSIRKNRVAQAQLEQRRRELDLEAARDGLIAEVGQAWGAVAESRVRLAVARQGEHEGDEALRIETARHEAGESTITELLDAEAALWSARVNRMQAGYDITASQARLLRAIGELMPASFEAHAANASSPANATSTEQPEPTK